MELVADGGVGLFGRVLDLLAQPALELDEVVDALGLPLFPWMGGPKPQMLRIVADRITGRRFRVTGGVRSTRPPTAR